MATAIPSVSLVHLYYIKSDDDQDALFCLFIFGYLSFIKADLLDAISFISINIMMILWFIITCHSLKQIYLMWSRSFRIFDQYYDDIMMMYYDPLTSH